MSIHPHARPESATDTPAASMSAPLAAELRADAANALAPCAEPAPPAAADPPGAAESQRTLDDYDWYPVLRKPRADGWSPATQRKFIEVLADTGSVMQAAMAVGKTKSSCYKLRRSPGAEGFDRAWRTAMDQASAVALDECFERALVGSDEPVFNREGVRIGRRYRQNDRLLMFLLRAYMPERFRHAARDARLPGKSPPPPIEPMHRALAQLAPPCPDRPEDDLDPDDLAMRIQCADILDGELPGRRRAAEPCTPDPMPLGEEFERTLEDAKAASADEPPLTDAEWASHRAMLLGAGGRRGDPEIPGRAY